MREFIMTRIGEFKLKFSSGNQCKAPSHEKFKYQIQICCGHKLDRDGFIIDHERVNDVVQRISTTPTSCEVIAYKIAKAVNKRLTLHEAFVKHITVQIKPVSKTTKAWIEYKESFN
jgi:hypothetical protein